MIDNFSLPNLQVFQTYKKYIQKKFKNITTIDKPVSINCALIQQTDLFRVYWMPGSVLKDACNLFSFLFLEVRWNDNNKKNPNKKNTNSK